MLKKLLKVGTTFFILLGCYWGYVHGFDLVLRQFQSERFDGAMHPVKTPKSRLQAQDLARLVFGPDHWTVTSELPYAYYNSQRGFWMYWQEYEEIKEENGVRYDGKRVRMHPFVMIGRSGDSKNILTLVSDVATLDLNQPIGLGNKPGSDGIKVEHALLEGNVRIRDDRGTPSDKSDDMRVEQMTYVDYDEAKRLITTESHVHIEDPDLKADGDGLEILLRKPDPTLAVSQSSSSSGFAGAEYAILQKNVHVVMRDVGNSGILPGAGAQAAPASRPAKAATTVDLTVQAASGDGAAKDGKVAASPEPVPLYVQSDSLMRIDFPPDAIPVAVGPPAPPAPTLVRFERKVVALHGRLDDDPNQLDCDTLRLTLVPPSETPAPGKGKGGPGEKKAGADGAKAPVASPAATEPPPGPTPIAAAAAGSSPGTAPPADSKVARAGGTSTSAEADASSKKGGLFGNLTLQKAHATGHVVWLQLRKQATKVRCSEMIHERSMPYRPDSTFFRGDATRPVWMEKVDYEPDEPAEAGAVAAAGRPAPDRPQAAAARKIKSVTHVLTISAKLFDRGNSLDLADIRAFGPGRLESRPDIGQPAERIAVWQDELTVVNMVGADGKLVQKRVTLTGTRPFFVDLPKKTSLDSGQEIRVFLKPRSTPIAAAAPASTAQAGWDGASATHVAARPPAGDAFATSTDPPAPKGTGGTEAGSNSGLGGSLQIERLLAYRDVHFKAPNRHMEARSYLDAPFVEFDPPPPEAGSAAGDKAGNAPAEGAAPAAGADAPKAGEPKSPASGAEATGDTAPEAPVEPAMTAVADRIWAKVAIPRGQALDPSKDRRKKAKSTPQPASAPRPETTAADESEANAATPAANPEPKEAEAQIRAAYLQGNVAVHQDKPPDPEKKGQAKPKGDDIRGEAVYLDNKGPGKINARVFHRNPEDPTFIPGPIQWAMVSTDDMIIYGQTLWMDQEHDKVWAFGPGVLNQWTARDLMTDKTPESPSAAPGEGEVAATMAARAPAAPDAKAEGPPKPKTRAGVPLGEKDLLTITWTKQMEFTGRTKAPTGHPAARADFHGIVDAKMTDATLHCEQKMIVYTDQEVPLGELDATRGGGRAGGRETPDVTEGDENAGREAPSRARVDIALLYCYGKPTAISRKVDPDLPYVIEQERIDAWLEKARSPRERLAYDRRTGEFFVPVPGMVFLFDRPDEKGQDAGQDGATGAGPQGNPRAPGARNQANGRTVRPTSGRSENRGGRTQPGNGPATAPVARKIQPLVLMQIKFTQGMIGRVGAGQSGDTQDERWSEFSGNIEFVRSQVQEDAIWAFDRAGRLKRQQILNPDQRLSEDGFYLTSQMLRVIQEPPPPGSPAKTPARSWAKAWDRVHVNKGELFAIESDVATFDSGSELLYAYGEGGHGVSLAHQAGPGQPPSTSQARAVQYNVKTKAWKEVDGTNLIVIDHRTGARPQPVAAPDPTRPTPPKVKSPFKVPNTNLERRGFTGF